MEAELDALTRSPSRTSILTLACAPSNEQHADLFFGQDALIAELVDKVRQWPFLAVMGPSGSGKSSVVRAGLIAALKDGALPGSKRWL